MRLVAVYSQPPRPAGRGLAAAALAGARSAAERLGLPVRTPREPARRPRRRRRSPRSQADLAVVAAYGLILPKPILAAPRLGCINLHASLLPRWRGAAPIQRALLAGDAETGITIFQMEPALDTGPILAHGAHPDHAAEHGREPARRARRARRRHGPAGGRRARRRAARARVPQPSEGVTYAAKIDKAEGRLDWSRPAALLERQLRALNPWPGCWTELGGQRLRVLAGALAERRDPARRARRGAGRAPDGRLRRGRAAR